MSDMTIEHQIQTNPPRHILILGFRDVLMMDIAGPAQVFSSANTLLGWDAYRIEIVTRDGTDARTDTGLSLRAGFDFSATPCFQDFIIPGGPGIDSVLMDGPTLNYVQKAVQASERVISVCSGSLLTAASGALDGKCATSHWERASLAAQHFPDVDWQFDHIFTHDGKFHCSAGVTAGIDLTLNLLEIDHGRKIALEVAREMVVFMQRDGGQSQYSRPLQAQSTANKRLGMLYAQIEANPTAAWTVEKMAHQIGTAERTLHRDFMRDLNMSPSRFVEERRLSIARTYLEQSPKTLKEIAVLSGFCTVQNMRRSFSKLLGILPSTYRDRFGHTAGI